MTTSSTPMINQDELHSLMQPYIRLTQRNVQLFTSFSASPEMVALWLKNGQKMFSQTAQSAASGKTGSAPQEMIEQVQRNLSDLGRTKAFAALLQGLVQSQMQFLVDLAQTNMAALSQAPAQMMESMQQAASNRLSAPEAQEEQPRHKKRREH